MRFVTDQTFAQIGSRSCLWTEFPFHSQLSVNKNPLYMYKYFFVVFVAAVGYLGYEKYFGTPSAASASDYSLAQVEQKPIPKKAFYSLWTDVAMSKCADAKEAHNLTPEECREKISQRSTSCTADRIHSTPDTIDTVALAKQFGRPYLECITPYYFCKGIEVKTEEQLLRHCR